MILLGRRLLLLSRGRDTLSSRPILCSASRICSVGIVGARLVLRYLGDLLSLTRASLLVSLQES